MSNLDHMPYLWHVAAKDISTLRAKEETYQGSWKRRGGVGVFMMMARKWDRLESMLGKGRTFGNGKNAGAYDLFGFVEGDPSGKDGTVIAELRDLRCYLMLAEAELISRGVLPGAPAPEHRDEEPGSPADGGHHARHYQYLSDGETDRPEWPHFTVQDGNTLYYNVARDRMSSEETSCLPRLQLEMNAHEFRRQQAWYKPMYSWNEAQAKYVLLSVYREHWGQEP